MYVRNNLALVPMKMDVHCATKHKELAIDEQPVKRKAAGCRE
jgi:hypothetical protein